MDRFDDYKKLADSIVGWLKTYAEDAKVNGFVVGVSGGIDSAVVSTLCARTGLRTICVTMPIHQTDPEHNRASKHITDLASRFKNVESVNEDMSIVYDHFIEGLLSTVPFNHDSSRSVGSINKDASADLLMLSSANLRSRMRMCALYHIATASGTLVTGTGNKVEDFGVGFFTKYGDGGVDLSPIASLYKTEVYQLGKHLGVIEEIIAARPTDGLWDDGRTDEDQIGATYPELEWAMDYVEKNPHYSIKDLGKLSERERRVLMIYKDRHRKNEHKMLPIPVFPLDLFMYHHAIQR